MKSIIDEYRRVGIVTDMVSPYASPVLLVHKKNGDPCLVIDFRKLNDQTIRINYPLPNLDEFAESLSGAVIFATLDLPQGYL